MINNLVSFFQSHWPSIKDFFNSVFFVSIPGALAGAFAGAYIAQKIAERNKNRDELLKEIRNTNAAMAVATAIGDTFFRFKGQFAKDQKKQLDLGKAQWLEFLDQRASGKIGKDVPFTYQADVRFMSLPPMPVQVLQQLVFEKLSLNGRALRLQIVVAEAVHSLHEFLEKRNRLIEEHKVSNHSSDKLVELYFGLPDKSGKVNAEYPSCVDAISSQTDNGIFFTMLLCDDLQLHGKQLCEKFAKQFGGPAPKAPWVDFSKAKELGLVPDAALYSDWTTGFVEKPVRKSWKRVFFEMLLANLKKLAYWGQSAR